MDDVELARKALEHAVANPSAFSPEEINAFADVVEKSQSSKPTVLPEVTVVGDPNAPATVAHDDQTHLIGPLAEKFPAPPDPMAHDTRTSPSKFALASDKYNQWHSDLFDQSASHSASRVKELVRDPEYHPPVTEHAGLLHPLEVIQSARQSIPHLFGGSAEHMYEPSLEQFKRDMAPALGDKVNGMTPESMEYKMYADAQWAKAYDQAKAEGRSAVRHSFKDDKTWGQKVASGAVGLAAPAAAALHGAADMMSFGAIPKAVDKLLPDSAEGRANIDTAHPYARTAGSVAGALSPGGLGNELIAGGGAALKAAAPGLSKVPSVIRSALQGAGAGGLDVVGRAGVNAATGEKVDTDQLLGDTGKSMLIGGLLGGGLDAVGAGAGAIGRGLRRDIPELAPAEAMGGKTSFLRGFVPGKRYGALKQEAEAAGSEFTPQSLLASKLERPLAEQGASIAKAGKEATGKVNETYYAEHAGTRVPVTPLLEKATELHSNLLDASGKLLPGQNERAAALLKAEISRMTKVSPAPLSEPGVIPFAEAEKLGIDVRPLLKGADEEQIAAIKSGMLDVGVRVEPRSYNPKETDTIIRGLDGALKAAQGPGGGPHPELNALLESSRAVRDQFPQSAHVPGGNWSSFKHDAHLQQLAEERAAAMASVPGDTRGGLLSANDAKALLNTTVNYGKQGRHPEIDQSLRALADRAGPGARQNLEDIRGVTATEAMQGRGKLIGKVRNGMPQTWLSPEAARIRLDPTLQRLSRPTQQGGLRGGYAGGAAAVGTGEQERRPMSFDEINRLLDPNQPY